MLLVCGKVNFTNLSRYSALSEGTYRRQYQQDFEFAALNRALVAHSVLPTNEWNLHQLKVLWRGISRVVTRFHSFENGCQASRAGTALLAVMDCSFVAKSGKATFGLDTFWNGTTSRVETGLEVSVVGIVDAESEQAYYALSAEQTYAQSSLSEFSRMDQYLYHLDCVRPHLPPEVEYLAVDGADAKESFVTGAVDLKLHVISKLRRDANLQFLYTAEQKRRGRPRKYAGKVDFTDLSRFTFVETVQPEVALYTAVVWHVSLKRSIRVAYLVARRHSTRVRTCLLFSTNLEQDPRQIVQYYKLRFQIEFLFRDQYFSVKN
jgi:hypothetical protein